MEEGLEDPPWAGIGLDRRGHCGSAGPDPWSMPRSCPHSGPSFHGGCCLSSALRCCLACFFPSLSLALSPTPICSLTLDYWFRLRGPKNVDWFLSALPMVRILLPRPSRALISPTGE